MRCLSPSPRVFLGVTTLTWILGTSLGAAGGAEWPQFRGPEGNGATALTGLPLRWDEKQGLAWKVALPGKGWSSPVLSGDCIYLTSAVENESGEVALHALCLSQADGRLIWDREVLRPESADAKKMHRKNSAASPTPVVEGGRVYVHFGHLGTAALDLEGKVLWKQESLKYKPVHGTGGSPALVDGALVFSADGAEGPFVAALDAGTGAVRWKTPREGVAKKKFSFSTPQAIRVDGEIQIISPGSGYVAAYRPQDGAERWRVGYGEGYSVVPRPVYAEGLLYVGSGFDAASLLAIRPEGAAGDVTQTHVAWTLKKGAPHTPSVIVVDGLLFCVSDAGIASCVDAKTGEVYWSERLGGNFSASPILAEGRIYFLNESGTTYVVKAAKAFELLATNELGERTLASPAPFPGGLFIRGEGSLYKVVSSSR
ncbi:MAG: hypothetical protein RLZZ142_2355 [Verrucomicrobiota bacterium]